MHNRSRILGRIGHIVPIPNESPGAWTGVDARPVTDQLLLAAISAGDEEALACLYDRYSVAIFSLALRMIGDRPTAQEVTQDTFVRVWERAAQYDPQRGPVTPWLFTIARRLAVDCQRRQQRQVKLSGESFFSEGGILPDPVQADGVDQVALAHDVAAAMARLSPAQRHAIELAYFGGLTHQDIATRTSTPLGTVKSRMRSALEALRSYLTAVPADTPHEDNGTW